MLELSRRSVLRSAGGGVTGLLGVGPRHREPDAGSGPGAPDREHVSLVRPVQAAAGAPAVDVSVDGHPAGTALGCPAAGEYVALPPGRGTVRFERADGGGLLVETDLRVRPGETYTVALADGAGPYAPVGPVGLRDGHGRPDGGGARLRVLDAVPDARGLDVTLPDLGRPVAEGLRFRAASSYVAVPAGRHALRVSAGAPGDRSSGARLHTVDLEAGSYTALVLGPWTARDRPSELLLLRDGVVAA